ncbi:hypothetical protein CTAYLR_009083 [Chrysophaeum taylorii]|uniref:SAM-dependent MTase RsmB/NOP-type domain-containing protein n=1 Tax=Chrysophaeum taylorii TaxID=2483200 RepID=A0AAD7UJL3_9STRA|nr:hypothetical protein CTAYLR_009083 [Chrysophaeum taylorii]
MRVLLLFLLLLLWKVVALGGREAAFDSLVARRSQFAEVEGRERALAKMLSTTVLRRQGEIDAEIERFYVGGSRRTRTLLRLGVAQLRYTGIAPHAAVHETVELAKRKGASSRVVNAVLRKIARAAPLPANPRLNASPWLLRHLEEEEDRFLKAVMEEPRLDVSGLDGETARLKEGSPFPGGDAWAQDAAAAVAARVLLESTESRRVLDACAAPGGKALQLAAAGRDVVAVDVSERRLRRLRENFSRLGLEAEDVVSADASDAGFLGLFDAILLDAPCTGMPRLLHVLRPPRRDRGPN